MKKDSSYGFVPYLIILFFIALSLIYSAWFYIAKSSYSGSVSSVEDGKGIYKKFPVKSNISKEIPFDYNLIIKQGRNNDWYFVIKFKKLEKEIITEVKLNLMSPVTNKYDQHIKMNKKTNDIYEAFVNCKEGQWDIEILVELNDKTYIVSNRRSFIKENL